MSCGENSDNMNIIKVTQDKKEHINLLLLADEQENMIDKYLEWGEMFVLDDNGIKAECVVLQSHIEKRTFLLTTMTIRYLKMGNNLLI